MKLIMLLPTLLLAVSCSRPNQSQTLEIEGIASVDGDGNIDVMDTQKHQWFGVYPDKAAKIPSEIADFRSTYKDRCWFRIFGVRASGTTFGKDLHLLRTTSISITTRYSDAEVPALLDRVQFQPLKTKHTCGSA